MILKKEDPEATGIATGSNKVPEQNLHTGDNISSLTDDFNSYNEKIKEKYNLLGKLQRISKRSDIHIGLTSRCCYGAYQKYIELKKGSAKRSYYSGIIKCGSPWICPHCSAKIMRIRQEELKIAIHKHKQSGGEVLHLVFTFRHKKNDSLQFLLDSFKSALKKFWEYGHIKKLLKSIGYLGRVTSTEITHGKNGWHPHQHILLFVGSDISIDRLNSIFSSAWKTALSKSGLSGLSDIACVIQDGSHTDKYVTKLSAELSLGNIKQGRDSDSMTFFDILHAGYIDLIKEYVGAVKGRYSIVWSKGLKSYFGIVNRTDEELANSEKQSDKVYLDMDFKDYKHNLSIDLRSLLQSLTDHEKTEKLKRICSIADFIHYRL